MSKNIKFQFEGNLYDINVTRNGNILTIEHEGQNYVVSIADQLGGVAAPLASQAPVAPAPTPVASPAPAAPTPVTPAPLAQASGGATETASMSGTIKQIKVSQGTTVKSGDLLLIMEAMKMDIEVFATHNGTVSAIHVTEGASVADGQALVDIA